ncbi:S-adenosyl-L-methionine-dependent methyltransferase [Rhodofomes roseus]|nr:S-adenosyl-L-methionine-dependent methyltransferase [Rhodofomes roseus]KAH9838484.1 S-adenosyl-L-methionine-dependent methyltransferase [Rhodofomes roseus]
MVDWALDHVPADPAPSILEVGAGNGNLLFALCEAGFAPGRMCGLDYSADAVKLARAIASAKQREQDAEEHEEDASVKGPGAITFAVCDFLAEDVPALDGVEGTATWDLVLDKGTFDAMALVGQNDQGVNIADGYPSRVGRVVKPGGYFLITSCNFTEEELKAKFATAETGLVYHSRIPFPSFSFGGKSGNVYSSVAFHKQP